MVFFRQPHIQRIVAVALNNPHTASCTLNGSASYDRGGKIISYKWKQVSGGSCVMHDTDSVFCEVTGLHLGKFSFSLTCVDNHGLSGSDTTDVTVIK